MTSIVRGIKRSVKNKARSYAPCECDVREATANEEWNPSPALLARIAEATFDPLQVDLTMDILWLRLGDPGHYWRHVHNALLLLEHLLKRGSPTVVRQGRENHAALSQLAGRAGAHAAQLVFPAAASEGAAAIRQQAAIVLALLDDDERLAAERLVGLAHRRGGGGGMGLRDVDAGPGTPSSSPPRRPPHADSPHVHANHTADDALARALHASEISFYEETAASHRRAAEEEERQVREALARSMRDLGPSKPTPGPVLLATTPVSPAVPPAGQSTSPLPPGWVDPWAATSPARPPAGVASPPPPMLQTGRPLAPAAESSYNPFVDPLPSPRPPAPDAATNPFI